jgi:hypothetical protein
MGRLKAPGGCSLNRDHDTVTRNSSNNLVRPPPRRRHTTRPGHPTTSGIAGPEGRVTLVDALIAKIDAAEQEGKVWYPLGR